MAGVDTVVETALPPEEVRRRLLDFSPDRPKVWPGISPALYKVYDVGETSAEIQEGTRLPIGAFWARERYEWGDGDTIRWTVVESNFCAPGSFVSARIAPRDGGGSRIEIHWERQPTTALARLVGFAIRRSGGKPVAQSFERGLAS